MDVQTLARDKTPVSTPVTIGSEHQSFLTTSRSYGSIHIDEDYFSISITNASLQQTQDIGSLFYSSRNNHYVDQSYIIEAGAVVINQSEGYFMATNPSIVMNNNGFDLVYTLYNIEDWGGKTDVGGYGTYMIQTNFSDNQYLNLTNITNIQINSEHPISWQRHINNTFQEIGLQHGLQYSISLTSNTIDVNVDQTAELDISFRIVRIFAQLSLGTIG
jgi:hypothetical protein